MTLRVDPARTNLPETGIYVRATSGPTAKWGAHDIAHLDLDSLREWLRSRGGDNPWAESVVATLLGHDLREHNPWAAEEVTP